MATEIRLALCPKAELEMLFGGWNRAIL